MSLIDIWRDVKFHYLCDDDAVFSGTYRQYIDSLKWRYWNVRPANTPPPSPVPVPGDEQYFTDPYGHPGQTVANPLDSSQTQGKSAYLLRGRYEDITHNAALPGSMMDYIIDIKDSAIVGDYPFWQYTWVAITNPQGLTPHDDQPDLLRVELYNTGSGSEGGAPWYFPAWGAPYSSDAQSYSDIKLIGIIDNALPDPGGSAVAFPTGNLNTWTGVNGAGTAGIIRGFDYFPHLVSHIHTSPVENRRHVIWNALAENPSGNYATSGTPIALPYSGGTMRFNRYYSGRDNSQAHDPFTGPESGKFRPYKIARYAHRYDLFRYTGLTSRTYQVFDIPIGHTLLAVITKTRDSNYSSSASNGGPWSQTLVEVGDKGWKIWDVRIRATYVDMGTP